MNGVARFALLLLFCFTSCQPEKIEEILDQEDLNLEMGNYMKALVNNRDFIVQDPHLLKGEIHTNRRTGVVSLTVSGTLKGKTDTVLFTLFNFKGKGTYYTGNDKDHSFGYYWNDTDMWFCDPGTGDPGTVTINYADDEVVSGSFIMNVYSYENSESTVKVEGDFIVEPRHTDD